MTDTHTLTYSQKEAQILRDILSVYNTEAQTFAQTHTLSQYIAFMNNKERASETLSLRVRLALAQIVSLSDMTDALSDLETRTKSDALTESLSKTQAHSVTHYLSQTKSQTDTQALSDLLSDLYSEAKRLTQTLAHALSDTRIIIK